MRTSTPGAGVPSQWVAVGGAGACGVTLENLRSATTNNLFGAGRVIGGQLRAGASVRVLGTSFAPRHATGVAAAITAVLPSVNELSGADLAAASGRELLDQGALLTLRAGPDRDRPSVINAQRIG